MNDEHIELKRKADELRKLKRFTEALPLYKALWEAPSNEPDQWVGWGYAKCLREIERYTEALDICREVYRINPQFDFNNDLYGWCIYYVGIKQVGDDVDEERFLKAASAIITITTQKNFSPYELTVFAVIEHYKKYEEKQKPVPYTKILDWLDKLNLDLLSRDADKSADGKTYSSSREKWYTNRAKALNGLERHEECIDICTEALSEFSILHYDYDVWFRQYRSEGYLALGQAEKALPDLEYMVSRKPDAWILHRYALGLYAIGKLDDAIRYACEAALPYQRLGYRWEVYLDLGNMLDEAGKEELAAKHILLATAIRHEEGWEKIPDTLQSALIRHNISLEDLPKAKSLHRELQTFWKTMKPRPKTTHSGVIIKIHDNGKSGNIEGTDGTKYFFGMRYYKGEAEAATGIHVVFNLQETENNRTGAKEMHAVDIRTDE